MRNRAVKVEIRSPRGKRHTTELRATAFGQGGRLIAADKSASLLACRLRVPGNEWRRGVMRRFVEATAIAVAVYSAGCAQMTVAPSPPAPGAEAAAVNQCATLHNSVDKAVVRSGVRDAQSATVSGFPYLRADRFLASFRNDELSEAQLDALLDRLQATAQSAWRTEAANLPPAEQDIIFR